MNDIAHPFHSSRLTDLYRCCRTVARSLSLSLNWGGWTRTTNFLINSQAVCQLTYAPTSRTQKRPPEDDPAGAFVMPCGSAR